RGVERRRIGEIERLGTELQLPALAEGDVLEERQIEIEEAIAVNVGERAGDVAKGKRRWRSKGVRVEPAAQRGVVDLCLGARHYVGTVAEAADNGGVQA